MPRKFVHGGLSYLTERPSLEQRFDNLPALAADFGGELALVGIAYDTRHRSGSNNPLLWLAGDTNKKLYCCDSVTMQLIEAFDYPDAPGTSNPCEHCYGLTIINTPTDNLICFLSEPLGTDPAYPAFFHLEYNAAGATPQERLSVVMYYNVSAGGNVTLNPLHIGMTEYMNDVMFLGDFQGNQTIIMMDKHGIPLAHYPAFSVADDIRGLMYMTQRVWTTIDGTGNTDINERYLAKFLTDEVDKQRMVPILGLEPFFFSDYFGDIALYQDRMAATHKNVVYLYKMIYYAFIVDSIPNDDIDMGSVLIGDYKIKRIIFKNIADYYRIRDIHIEKLPVTCPGGATVCPAKEAASTGTTAWVKFSVTDPFSSSDPSAHVDWGDELTIAAVEPYVNPDGEREFWVKIAVPEEYATIAGREVSVDDGPFIIPIQVSVKVG